MSVRLPATPRCSSHLDYRFWYCWYGTLSWFSDMRAALLKAISPKSISALWGFYDELRKASEDAKNLAAKHVWKYQDTYVMDVTKEAKDAYWARLIGSPGLDFVAFGTTRDFAVSELLATLKDIRESFHVRGTYVVRVAEPFASGSSFTQGTWV